MWTGEHAKQQLGAGKHRRTAHTMAALVACQQCRIAGIAVPSPSIAGGLGQVFDAGKPEIEAMRRHRMHADGGITGERKAWPDEAPRPGRAPGSA